MDGEAVTVAGAWLAETAWVVVEFDSIATASLTLVEATPIVVVGGSVVVVVEVEVDVTGVGLVDVVEEDVVDDELVVVVAGVVDGTVSPPLAAVTSAIKSPTTQALRFSPGQVVLLIVLCPARVRVVTEAPDGHLFDPREVNDTVEPGEVATS